MYELDEFQMFGLTALILFSLFILKDRTDRNNAIVIYFFLMWTFLQYFLAPFISFFSGGWSTLMLKPLSVDRSIVVAGAFVLSVVGGYVFCRSFETGTKKQAHPLSVLNEMVEKKPSSKLVLYALIMSVSLIALSYFLTFGSLENLFVSTIDRGYGQFNERTLTGDLSRFLRTASTGIGGLAAFIIGLRIGHKKNPSILDLVKAIALVSICSISFFASFSRGSGLFMIVAATAIQLPKKMGLTHKVISILLFAVGFYLCFVGFTQRDAEMGVSSFVLAALYPNFGFLDTLSTSGIGEISNYAILNFFDALAPISAHIHFSDRSDQDILTAMKSLFFALQPLPSSLFSNPVQFGPNLRESFGITGSTNLTSPALAELYFLFGWPLIFLGAAYGWLLRRVDVLQSTHRGKVKYLIFLLIIGGIVISGHSGLRAFARPTIIALTLMWLSKRTYVFGKFRMSI
ncbi:hypothetical protein AB9F26_11350 [Falsihalocynthiibacter sp. BN13B15]|uniref:hypothetical protein n=1 Tax=Falsihalocynthiibacter sp. BN13B15 TaxID=3240871 RepID=UPI00350F4388